jgi:hypothetical protein
MLPINEIFSKYHGLADLLIDEVNATSLTLVYNVGSVNTDSDPSLNSAFSQDVHGGLAFPLDTKDLSKVTTTQESILVRSYWNKGNDSKLPADLRDNFNICKINCYSTDVSKILNASYYILNGFKCKRVSDPTPYGFEKRYSIFYLEKFADASTS